MHWVDKASKEKLILTSFHRCNRIRKYANLGVLKNVDHGMNSPPTKPDERIFATFLPCLLSLVCIFIYHSTNRKRTNKKKGERPCTDSDSYQCVSLTGREENTA